MDVRLTFLVASLIGVVSGALSGAFGIGGAVVSTPGVRLLLGAPAKIAVGTTLPPIIPTALFALWAYVRAGKVQLRVAALTAASGTVFSLLGAAATSRIRGEVLLVATAAVLFVLAMRILRGSWAERSVAVVRPGLSLCLLTGAASGFIAGLLGVGGGIVLIPVFAGVWRLPIKTAVGTSLAVVAAQAIPATVEHALLGNVNWTIALGLTAGVAPGALAGSRIAVAARDATMRRVVGLTVAAVAVLFAATQVAELVR